MMRTKLGLSENELMKSSWINLNLQMYDFPYYDSKKKHIISSKDEADAILGKYIKNPDYE